MTDASRPRSGGEPSDGGLGDIESTEERLRAEHGAPEGDEEEPDAPGSSGAERRIAEPHDLPQSAD